MRAVETALSAHLNAACVGSFCIDGAHLDSLDHVLTETKKKHTQTGGGAQSPEKDAVRRRGLQCPTIDFDLILI